MNPELRARDRALVEAARAGSTPATIARETGLSRGLVYQVLRAARARGVELPHFPTGGRPAGELHVVLPPDLALIAGPAAARRGIAPAALVRRIVAAVLEGELVDAVLDDAEPDCDRGEKHA